jgi:hypothetical protein
MRRSSKRPAMRTLAAIIGFGAILAGCSDIYYDRRETLLFGADNAVASNNAVQTIDPWPRSSADRSAPANGERVEAAIKRYRTGKVFQPIGTGTSSTNYQQQQQQQQDPQDQSSGANSTPNSAPSK